MTRGLFIGRFQPLHQGHLLMLKQLVKQVDCLIVGLGSVNQPPSCKNPWTVKERREFIIRGMRELGILNYEIVELADFKSDAAWIAEVKKVVVKFDRAWSGSAGVIRVFKKYNLPMQRLQEFPGLSGTKIRKRMAQGLPWLKYLPLSVRRYLKEIKAVKRVRALCQPSS